MFLTAGHGPDVSLCFCAVFEAVVNRSPARPHGELIEPVTAEEDIRDLDTTAHRHTHTHTAADMVSANYSFRLLPGHRCLLFITLM